MEESFGDLLARYRKKANLTQKQIANEDLKLSASNIALLESQGGQDRKTPLTEDQVWYLIEQIKIFPPNLDEFLDKAQQTRIRNERRELYIQRNYPHLKELWIFARVIRDIDPEWYEVVKERIKSGTKYCYFTSDYDICQNLAEDLLLEDGITEEDIKEKFCCFLLPDEFFLNNFAIYNPGVIEEMYCCGGIAEQGKGITFYTCNESEAVYYYNVLKKLKNRILRNQPIGLTDARYLQFPVKDDIFTKVSRSVFISEKFKYKSAEQQ